MYDLLEDDLGGPLPSGPLSMKGNLWSGVLLPLLFGRWEEKEARYIYFMRRLPLVQNLDFCLIGQKTKDPPDPRTDWLQTTYLTPAAIR